jgi:hypothetical protein
MVTRARTPVGRSRRRTPADASTTPQRDEATGRTAERPAAQSEYAGMKLPHERDESAEQDTSSLRTDGVRPEMAQAATDIQQGRRDTDCYSAVGPRYRRRQRKGG